jgi:hypothetical protein
MPNSVDLRALSLNILNKAINLYTELPQFNHNKSNV